MSKATTLSCGDAVRVGGVTVTYASCVEGKGGDRIVLHFSTSQSITVLKRDGTERIISEAEKSSRPRKLIVDIAD